MALATEREPTTYSSLQMLHWAILAYYEPMPTRLVSGCIAMAFRHCSRPCRMHAAALLMQSTAASMTGT